MNYFAQQKWLKWAFGALLLLNITILGLLFKDQLSPQHSAHTLGPQQLIIEKTALSAEQQSAYETLIDVHRAVVQDLHRQLSKKKKDYFIGLGTESEETQESQLQEIQDLQRHLEARTYRHFLEVRELLSPEQQVAFDIILPQVVALMLRGPGRGPRDGKQGPPPPRP